MFAHTSINARPLVFALQQIGRRGFPLTALAAIPGLALAELPGGGAVVGGAASIANLDANHQRITQTTDRAIINWQTFSIGASDYVQFVQPGASSVALNRVTGGTPSSILGSLSANGQVFLVNPNGVYFGPGAQIDVAGLVATTLGIGDSDFMAGRYVFSRDPASPARAEVINRGVIAAREGGYVVLAGDYAANSGTIQARLGTVALAAGSRLTLDLVGDRLISFAVDEKTLAQLAGVSNTGQLMADGGRVFMTAKVAGDLAAMAVNSQGLVQAQSMVEHDGEIYLAADGGSIRVSGTLDASAQPGADGGHVSVVARGGGDTVLAGGSLIKVSGNDLAVSNAGSVYTWADGTACFEKGAAIEARGGANGGDGGFVEVSGHNLLFRGMVDAHAPRGKNGTLLLDPADFFLGADGSASSASASMLQSALEGMLQGGTNTDIYGTNSVVVRAMNAGVLDGRNGGAGGNLSLRTGADGTISMQTADAIRIDGHLFIGNSANFSGWWGAQFGSPAASLDAAPNTMPITLGTLQAKDITINGGTITVGAMTAQAKGSADTTTSNINVSGTGDIHLNGPISIRSNWAGNSGAYLNVRTTNGNIVHASGSTNAIVVGNTADSGGAAAYFTASNGTVTLGEVSALSAGNKARIDIQGNQGVTLAGAITVQGRANSSSSTGARLDVRADNGDINHTGGEIRVTNLGSGGAVTCFAAGGGSCSGSMSPGVARSITLGKLTVNANDSGGWAQVAVNATGGIALQDDVTAQGFYRADIGLNTWNGSSASTGITLAAGKTVKGEVTGSSGGARIQIQANNNTGIVNLTGSVVAHAAGSGSSASANVDIQGGTVTVGAITAGNASPSVNVHRGQVNIQSRSGDITLNGSITVTGLANGSGARLYVQAANNLNHTAGSATAISVRNYNPANGDASASFQAGGTATIGKVSVQGFEGADINVRAQGGIAIVDDLTVTADGGAARMNLYRCSGCSPGPFFISLANGKTLHAIATGSADGTASVDMYGSQNAITLGGPVIAEGGGGSNGRATININNGSEVSLAALTANAGGSAQIVVQGTNITLGGGLTAANSVSLQPQIGGGGGIAGNGYLIDTAQLQIRGGPPGTGSYDVTTNAATIDVHGGTSLTVNAAAQTGTLTALLGGSSSGQAVGSVSITTAAALNITQFYTSGTTHLLRADTLTLPGSVTMPAASAVTLKPYTLTNTVGVHNADPDAVDSAAIQTSYSATLLNLFPSGTTLTIGGASGGQHTGNIHVGADGAFDIGDKNIVFDTSGSVVTHNAPTTTGTVTILVPVVPVVPPVTPAGIEPEVEPEVSGTFTSVTSNLDAASGGAGTAGGGEVGRSLTGLMAVGGSGHAPPPVLYEIRED